MKPAEPQTPRNAKGWRPSGLCVFLRAKEDARWAATAPAAMIGRRLTGRRIGAGSVACYSTKRDPLA